MEKPRVFVTFSRNWFPFIGPILEEKFEVEFWKNNAITKEELIGKVEGVFGIVCTARVLFDEDVIKAAGESLKVVSIHSAGYEKVDINALKSRGIKVGYLGPINSEATAEMAVTLLLSVARQMKKFIKSPADYGRRTKVLGFGLQNATVGIVGCGLIGSSIAKKLNAFSIRRLMYFARSEKPEVDAIGGEFRSLPEIMKASDFVVVSLSLNEETKKIISKDLIDKMKRTAIFVNVGRGELVDQDALTEALQLGKIAGAGLDVAIPDPLPVEHPLYEMDNVVISPHVGSHTFECLQQGDEIAAENILAVFEGRKMPMEL